MASSSSQKLEKNVDQIVDYAVQCRLFMSEEAELRPMSGSIFFLMIPNLWSLAPIELMIEFKKFTSKHSTNTVNFIGVK